MLITVNALDDISPMQVVKTIKAINAMTGPGTVESHVDNEIAVRNVLNMAAGKGYTASSRKAGEAHYVITIEID